MKLQFCGAALLAGILAACSGSQSSPDGVETTPAPAQMAEWSHGGMVAAADPRAVQAGMDVLNAGGHAVDAAIAVHSVLGLVEPQSSGLGGGAFMLVYERETDRIVVIDGREVAPASASAEMFLGDSGEPLNFIQAWQSGKSVGVPGQVALYKTAHDMFGKNEWSSLFEMGITLADNGFIVSPRLANVLANPRLRQLIRLDDNPTTAAYFYPEGEPLSIGAVRDNPEYAETLRRIANEGPSAFYSGRIAAEIIDAAAQEPMGAQITEADLQAYAPIVREAVCGTALQHRICSAPPPSSGGMVQNSILGLYDRMVSGISEADMSEEAFLQVFVDAQRLAYADRDHYIADADMVTVPTLDLINPKYLDARVKDRFAPDSLPTPGDPGEVLRGEPIIDMWGRDQTEDAAGTTHISIIDTYGNAVSMTATVEAAFGSSRWAAGFLLNNELTDFSLSPTKNGKPVANAPAAGKRPRSSMSPTMVFDESGDLFMVTGSPGGNSIVAYVAKTLVGVLHWEKSAQEAINLPNIIARGESVGVETSQDGGAEAGDALKSLGYKIRERSGENSGLHVIVVREDGLEGGADPRREGIAVATD